MNWKETIVSDINTLSSLIDLNEEEIYCLENTKYKWATTRHFISLMHEKNSDCPIRKQVIPSIHELTPSKFKDYLIWKENRNDKNIPDCIARQYKDRIAFLVSNVCSSYCRYCFRKEAILDTSLNLKIKYKEGLDWISNHKEIRDVLITGGDPLMLSNTILEYLLIELRSIPHIEMVRIGTRMPVVLPERIDNGFLKIIKGKYRTSIWINIQCNHPNEITKILEDKIYKIICCGVNVGNQSVLLKGINDSKDILRKLNQELLRIRVRPYYLFHCEPAPGNEHFSTSFEEGCKLIDDALLGHTSGLARPHYVIATNKGKIPCRKFLK